MKPKRPRLIGLSGFPAFEPDASRPTTFYHLDRINSLGLSYDSGFSTINDGQGVDIYFFDTGCNIAHDEFNLPGNGFGRADIIYNPWPENYNPLFNDHGTSVMSAAIGQVAGIANQARGISIRVLRQTGQSTYTGLTREQWGDAFRLCRTRILEGYAATDGNRRQAIVNFSMFLPETNVFPEMRAGVDNLIAAGATVVGCIGQSTSNSVNYTRNQLWPVNRPNVIAAGMTDSDDDKVDFAWSFGGTVFNANQWDGADIFAPAGPKFQSGTTTVLEPGIGVAASGGGFVTNVGSSFAAPQVAGSVAQYLAAATTYTPAASLSREWLFEMSNKNRVDLLDDGDSNRLIWSRAPIVVARNAASFNEGSSPDSLGSAFAIFSSTVTRIEFWRDGIKYGESVPSFANSTQVNFYTPPSVVASANSAGFTYNLKAFRTDSNEPNKPIAIGPINIKTTSPGLQSYDGDGNGVAAGQIYLVNKSTEAIDAVNPLVPGGNAWNPSTHAAILVIYGTGFRFKNSATIQFVKGSTIYSSGTNFLIGYIGASAYNGQDQINIGPLPDDMGNNKGTYQIKLYVDGFPSPPGKLANIVEVKIN